MEAQTNSGVTRPPENFLIQNPVFAKNPAALELITNLLAGPQPELSVPEFFTQADSASGTYWTLTGAAAPLPLDPFPDLPVYETATNQYLIDDRSVDYAALAAQQQAENEAEGLTNQTISTYTLDTNNLWLQVPTNSLATPGYFTLNVMNAIQGQSYDILTKTDLLLPGWTIELTVTGTAGNVAGVQLSMNDRTNLFVWARVSTAYSFYINTPPMSQNVEDGDMVTFSVETGGNPNLTFQWTFKGTNIDGATNSSYTIYHVQDSEAGAYACIISDGTNSLVTPAAQLTTDSGNPLGPYQTGDFNLIPVLGVRQDYTFRSGVTYYINSAVSLYGNTTIEAGAVLKIDSEYSTNSSLIVLGTLTCKGEPYAPAILTSIDDDSAGEVLGSSLYDGPPQTAGTGVPYLDLTYAWSSSISNLRICFADWGVTTPVLSRRLDVWDCQFVQCNYGVVNLVGGTGATDSLHNVLFAACGAAVGASTNAIAIEAEQVTAGVANFYLASPRPSRLALTNSLIFGNPFKLPFDSVHNVMFNPDATNFVAEGYAGCYLAANSPLRGAGTANISQRLQTELQNKTTCAPISIAAFTQITGSLTLSPQASRYTGGAPDLGYYYDALDYSVASLTVAGGNLTVLPGTAIAVRNDFFPGGCYQGDYQDGYYTEFTVEGIVIQQGSSIVSHGTPTRPNIFTAEKMVQEYPETDFAEFQYYNIGWFGAVLFVPDFEFDNYNSPAPTLDFRFSKFYLPPNDYHFWSGYDIYGSMEMSSDSSMYLSLQDCNFQGGQINLGCPDFGNSSQVYAPGAITWVNNSFENVSINLDPTWYWYNGWVNCDMQLLAYNNLFKGGGWLILSPFPTSAGNWTFKDNLFDKVDFVQDANLPLDFDYNGYWPKLPAELMWDGDASQLQPSTGGNLNGANEQVLTTAPPYQAGPFGNYYLPNTTALYGAGSRSPGDAGLYHYTTRVDQVKEGDDTSKSNVNIGLHYVAATNSQPLGAPEQGEGGSTLNYQPIDTDGDGVPDYVEDANGNGYVDANETDWQNPMTDGVTPDAYSSVYDDIDLSGDGLVGCVKAALGLDPFCPTNPLTLTQVAGNNQNMITFKVPISYNVLTNAGFLGLSIDGHGATMGAASPAPDGNTLFTWNSTYDPPGQHYLQAELTLNMGVDGTEVTANDDSDDSDDSEMPVAVPEVLDAAGPIVPFYSANVVRFFRSDSVFSSSGAYLDAQLPPQYAGQNVNYTIQLNDPSTTPPTLLTTITGSTSDGIIQEDWGVTNADGTPFTGDTVNAVFNVTLPSGGNATGNYAANDAGGGGGGQSDPGINTLTRLRSAERVSDHDGFDFAYFYTPPSSGLEWSFGKFSGNEGPLWQGMQNAVDMLLAPPMEGPTGEGLGSPNYYVSWLNHYTFQGNPEGRCPGYIESVPDVYNLRGDMMANIALLKNMYISGHGNINIMGTADNYSSKVKIKSEDVAGDLNNNQGNIVEVSNPYRFVFLDGCRTAKEDYWPNAFGIFSLENSRAVRPQLDAQAFVGWGDDGVSWTGGYYYFNLLGLRIRNDYKSVITAWSYSQTLKDFYNDWINGFPLAQCIANASQADVYNQVPLPVSQVPIPRREFWVYTDASAPDGYEYANFKVKKRAWKPAPIYVIGHSGLKRYGSNEQFDGQYARPW